MMEKRIIELKGNELGWIIKLAQTHLTSQDFHEYLIRNELYELQPFLHQIMGQFHETNFYAGTSEDKWILTNDTSSQIIEKEVEK